jgi:hypothetical protein
MSSDGLIFNINSILDTKVASNGSIIHQIGTLKTATGKEGQPGEVYDTQAQSWTICGISTVPVAPDGTQNCAQSISISRSDQDIILATRDTRRQPTDITYGEVYIYNGDLSSVIQVKADGVININTNNNVNITSPMTQVGDTSAQALAYNAFVTQIQTILEVFMTSSSAPNPFAAAIVAAAATALTTLQTIPTNISGGTTKMKAT